MSFFHSFAPAVALLFLANLCSAAYDNSSRSNVALYWGQGPNQQRLAHFCAQTTVDVIPIGFVNVFPGQGNGYPGTNFGNQCWGGQYVYPGPGNNPSQNSLQSECPNINTDIPVCQATYKKKIILSLGGGPNTYQLNGAANGTSFADFLWGAFGPQTDAWLKSGLPRPFDGPNGEAVEVDGFDFDIEHASTDNAVGYIAMITRLRLLFASAKKQYIITGAPQCVVPDANMAAIVSKVKFDILWIQFYNTPACSARNWVNHNPNYASTGVELSSGFSYNSWATFLAGTASASAKLYIGVPGGTPAAMTGAYLTPAELSNLVKAYYCKASFGGVMIWEATYAENNAQHYSSVKNILTGLAANKALSCYKAPATSTSSVRASTTSKKSSSTFRPATTSSTRKTTSTAHTTTKSSSSSKRSSSTFHTTTTKT